MSMVDDSMNAQYTYWWEGFDRLLLQVILVQIELSIVDGKSTLGTIRSSKQGLDGCRRDTVIGTIGRMLEV
jgi:hypothetical protein